MKKYLFTILVLLFIQVANALPPSIPGFKNRFSDSTVFYTDGVDTIGASVNGISFKRFYNVAWYGAVDDGTTSSYHAFDSALTLAVNDTLGGVVYIPPGSYSIDTPLVKLATLTKRVAVIGSGSNSRIIIDSTGFLKFGTNTEEDGSREWLFADFEIYSNQTGATYGIQLEGGGNVEIRGVNVLGNNNLGTAFRFLATQQGSIKDLYIKQCSTAVYFKDTTMSVTDVNPNMITINNISIAGGGETNSLYGVVFNGSQTGVLTNSHITACSTHVSVDYSEGITISNNHFETGRTGVVVNAGSMVNIFNNRFYTVDTSLYLKGGSRHTIIGNLFNTEVILGAGATKSNLMWNLFGNPVVDSNTATNDNRNRYFGNQNQGTGNGYQGLSFNSQTADSLDLWLRSTGDIHVQFDGVESTYVEVYASGVDAPYGFRFDNYAEIAGNTSTRHGLRFYTNNSSNALTERFKIAGAADSVRISISNANKIILPPAVWVGNATDSALITEPFIDSIRANQFGTGGAGETNTLSDTGTYNGTEGFGLAGGKTGTALKVKGLIEGSNVTITASGDSAYSIASSGGSGAWTQQDGNDSLRLIQKNGTDSLIYITADTTNDTVKITSDYTMIIGEEGLTISDSLLIDTILYIVSPGGTDTVFITNVFIDSVRNGDFGGSGSADSAIIDFGSNVYKSSSAKAWSLKFGQALQHTTPTDSSGIDTFTVYVDTNAIALIVEDSLNEYLLTSTASSTYEPLLVNEAGLYSALSDVSNFLQLSDSADGVADGVAQFVTSNGVYDYLVAQGYLTSNETITLSGDVSGSGTTSITTTIGASRVDSAMLNSTEITEYNSDRVGAMVSGNSESGIAVTYQDADNTLDFAVQNVTSSMIFNQTIVGADVDSTSANFIFDDAYKGTSAVPDSILITRRELDDSLDAVRSENAGLFQPIGHGDADSLKGVPIPNTPTTGDDGKGLTYFETGDTLGWVAYPSQAYVDSVGEAADNDTLALTDLNLTGTFYNSGQYGQQNHANYANINDIYILLPDTHLVASQLPVHYIDSTLDDTARAVHPSNMYYPKGFYGYNAKKKLMGFTPLPYEEHENPSLVWANANSDNWELVVFGTDTLFNPIFTPDSITGRVGLDHLSDFDIFSDYHDSLWGVFRISYNTDDSQKIAITKFDTSASGVPQFEYPSFIVEEDGGSMYAPSIIKDTNQSYTIYYVMENAAGDSTFVARTRHGNSDLRSGWLTPDTVNLGRPQDSMKIWHIEVLERGLDELLMLVTACPDTASGGNGALYLAVSYDRGDNWFYANDSTPVRIFGSGYTSQTVYRSSGYWVDDGSGGYLDLYMSNKGTSHGKSIWTIDHCKLFFNQANAAVSPAQLSDSLGNYLSPGDTKNRMIDVPCNDVVGRITIPETDSLVLTGRTTLSDVPVLAIDSNYDASLLFDTLRFTWDALPEDIVSVDSVIFTYYRTSTAFISSSVIRGHSASSFMADSTYATISSGSLSSSSWARQAYYVGNSDFGEGEQLVVRMRNQLSAGSAIVIGRMYLKCTVQYTY